MNIKKNILLIITIVALFLLVFFLSNSLLGRQNGTDWYAMKLADGNTFYGHIVRITSGEIVMEDVYSIELTENKAEVSGSQNFQLQSGPQKIYNLVHRGTNLANKTDNQMIVNRASVMFWERLMDDAQIVSLIEKAKEQK